MSDEAAKDLGVAPADTPAEQPSKPFNLEHHIGAFIAGAKDFGEDMKSMAAGELKGPSMKHRLEHFKKIGM
jgi:hypothetical protein